MKYKIQLIIFFIIAGNLFGSDSIPPNIKNQYYKLTIESMTYENFIELDTIDVTLESNMPLGGFDLKISTSSNYYEIVDVLKGDFSQKCNWEYFNKREVNDRFSTWHVVSLAKMITDTTTEICYNIDSSAVLLRLVLGFKPVSYTTPLFDMGQIRFKWDQCKDNTISSVSGDTLMIFNKLLENQTEPYAPPKDCYLKLSERLRNLLIFENGDFKVNFDLYQNSDEVLENNPEIKADSL